MSGFTLPTISNDYKTGQPCGGDSPELEAVE